MFTFLILLPSWRQPWLSPSFDLSPFYGMKCPRPPVLSQWMTYGDRPRQVSSWLPVAPAGKGGCQWALFALRAKLCMVLDSIWFHLMVKVNCSKPHQSGTWEVKVVRFHSLHMLVLHLYHTTSFSVFMQRHWYETRAWFSCEVIYYTGFEIIL